MVNNAEMTRLRLKWLELSEDASPLAVGKFNKEAVPVLDLKKFDEEMTIRTAVSPDCGFRLLKEAFDAAEETLDIYIYNISAEHIIRLVRENAAKLKRVRLMYDVHDDGKNEAKTLGAIPGLEFKTAPSNKQRSAFTVCHQKLVITDNKQVFMGSANFAGTSFPEVLVPGKFKKGNREWVVRILNENVAAWYADLFEADWKIPESGPAALAQVDIDDSPGLPELPLGQAAIPGFVADIAEKSGRIALTPVVSPDNYFDEILAAIRKAKKSILVQQQDIKAKFNSEAKVDQLLTALAERKADGVDVLIITSPRYPSGWEHTIDSVTAYELLDNLRAMNLKMYEHLHNKGLIFDRKKVLVTSTNWTENSINFAREAGVLIDEDEIAEYYANSFDHDWDEALMPDEVPAALVSLAAAGAGATVVMDSNPVP